MEGKGAPVLRLLEFLGAVDAFVTGLEAHSNLCILPLGEL